MEDSEGLVRRHDQYQFEVKLGYDLIGNSPRDRYKVETYFFLPENLDVNPSTYSKNQFYRDLLLYIRFKTPDFTLDSLADRKNDRSPLVKIDEKIQGYLRDPSPYNASILDYEIRLLGCVVKSALRNLRAAGERALRKNGKPDIPGFSGIAEEFIAGSLAVSSRFRDFKEKIASPLFPRALRDAYAFTDEYMSLLIERNAHGLLRAVQNAGIDETLSSARGRLKDIILSETARRTAEGYPSLAKEEGDNEYLVFRLSVLKKYVGSVLYLNVRTETPREEVRTISFTGAAAMAMIFAALVILYYQKKFGTLPLLLALFISFMFKDLIKDFIQSYLQKKIARRFFDQSTKIFAPFNGEKIGVCRESMNFIDEKNIDPAIMRLRNRDHITEIENTWRREEVIHYRKEITLYSKDLVRQQSRKTAVTDIVRFNLRSFLWKMDEPNSHLHVLRDGNSVTLLGTRVYHVNMIIKFTGPGKIRYERLRLVLTRQGIKRIETVSAEEVSTSNGPPRDKPA